MSFFLTLPKTDPTETPGIYLINQQTSKRYRTSTSESAITGENKRCRTSTSELVASSHPSLLPPISHLLTLASIQASPLPLSVASTSEVVSELLPVRNLFSPTAALADLALAKVKAGQFEDADALYKEVIKVYRSKSTPIPRKVLENAAFVKLKLNQFQDADYLYTSTLAAYGSRPIPPSILANAASTKFELYQFSHAQSLYKKVLKTCETSFLPPQFFLKMALAKLACLNIKDSSNTDECVLDKIKKLIQSAINEIQKNPITKYNQSTYFFAVSIQQLLSEKFQNAYTLFREAQNLYQTDDPSPVSLLVMGCTYLRSHDTTYAALLIDQARENYRRKGNIPYSFYDYVGRVYVSSVTDSSSSTETIIH